MCSLSPIADLVIERCSIIHEAMQERAAIQVREEHAKYVALVQLCAEKRPYAVPPEYSGILDVKNIGAWSPTDCEVARVFVAVTLQRSEESTPYSEVAQRLNIVMTHMRLAHIYRSLRVILTVKPERKGVISGVKLR